ncbi:MAG: glycosyltransferase involved in cell wall biosynthesis [Hyphomicrobiaceae bacterium]|jgi:glycosyltransferase involved in cell wall biosynthesis
MQDADASSRACDVREQIVDQAIGIVVIGRNEGSRLERCLRSVVGQAATVVYVDSGSDDGSTEFARALGVSVIDLDTSIAFTAARARNAGLTLLRELQPGLQFVQFLDGDCEVEKDWLAKAISELRECAELAVVFGRRRERAREVSPYNRICDLEWDVPAGSVLSCGGDAMMRSEALTQVGGYDANLIAGEEPDLCLRMRGEGWQIRCVDAPMTVHDADMHRWSQWWLRSVRAGYVEAEGVAMRGKDYPRYRAALSNVFWSIVVPLLGVLTISWSLWLGSLLVAGLAIGLFAAAYVFLWRRIAVGARQRWPRSDARLYATSCMLGKWPSMQGMIVYWWRRLLRRDRSLIEYKQDES